MKSHYKANQIFNNVRQIAVVCSSITAFVCCALFQFARALGSKKRIWYITTSKHVRFDQKQGHLYKTDKEIVFFGTEVEMHKKLDITPNASTATDITNEKISTYFCLN